jgi:hypothetical protein
MPTDQRLSAVTNHTAQYIHRWCTWGTGYTTYDQWNYEFTLGLPDATARVLLAAGCGPARIPSCEHILRHECTEYTSGMSACALDVRPVLRRALSLFGAGELRTLCVAGPDVIDFVTSLLQSEFDPPAMPDAGALPANFGAAKEAPPLGFALDALCTVAWPPQPKLLDAAFALIERHAATITTLDCRTWAESDAAERAIARCTRLQSLSRAEWYSPTSWLQCTQLHTLRDVDFAVVSVATIATALPRLHTLTAEIQSDDVPADAVAGFFEDLLPRLQVFHFKGTWPSSREDTATAILEPGRCPQLQELVWHSYDSEATRRFIGARPVTIHTSHEVVADWLAAADGNTADGMATGGPLTGVRNLRVSGAFSSFDVAPMLRAAPQLRNIAVVGLHGAPFWPTLAGPHPGAKSTLSHARVRSIVIEMAADDTSPPSADAVTRLRERDFPHLRELKISGYCPWCHRLPYQAACPADCGGWWCPNAMCGKRCAASARICPVCKAHGEYRC